MDLGFPKGGMIVIGGGYGSIGQPLRELLHKEGLCTEVLDLADGVDLSDPESVKMAFERLRGAYSSIYGYVSIAAGPLSSVLKNFLEATPADMEEQWRGTLLAAFYPVQESLRWMRDSGKGGHIVMVSSVNSLLSTGLGEVPYDLAKAAVNKMVSDIAAYYGRFGVYATVFSPGSIANPLWEESGQGEDLKRIAAVIPDRKVTTPEEVAGNLTFLLSPYGCVYNGKVLDASRGWGLCPEGWKINKTY